MKTTLFSTCEYAQIDQNNKLNLISIFDELEVNTFPGGLSNAFFVVVQISGGSPKKKINITIKVKSVGGGKCNLAPLQKTVKFGENGKTYIIVQLADVSFNKPDEYIFITYHKKVPIGKMSLIVSGRESLN